MKMNIDCIRDVLLFLESYLTLNDNYNYNDVTIDFLVRYTDLKKYDGKDIAYSVLKLAEADHIKLAKNGTDTLSYKVYDITFSGYQFIENLRNSDRFNKTRSVCEKLQDFSFSLIASISQGLAEGAVSALAAKNL